MPCLVLGSGRWWTIEGASVGPWVTSMSAAGATETEYTTAGWCEQRGPSTACGVFVQSDAIWEGQPVDGAEMGNEGREGTAHGAKLSFRTSATTLTSGVLSVAPQPVTRGEWLADALPTRDRVIHKCVLTVDRTTR